MLQGWVVVVVALAYIGFLFVVASLGDRAHARGQRHGAGPLIYPLTLAIYCTSWTFFGSVGLATRSGYEFLTIYIGPIVMVGLCTPLVRRVVRLAKTQNITSIADFIASRYGKGQTVAATVALIALIGSIPYIALQLKAVSASLNTILAHTDITVNTAQNILGDLALFVALAMAAFAVLFGTRHIDATEHQDGLMLAIATESIVKLLAFVSVGVAVTFFMFDGPAALFARALQEPQTAAALAHEVRPSTLITMTLLSFVAVLLLPRQFHVTVVENRKESDLRRAAWMFPVYLILINIFVLPIALGGMLTFSSGTVDSDMFVLALPLTYGSGVLAIFAFVGGLSAATAMVIVETVAVAIMVSNDLIIPLVLKRRGHLVNARDNMGALLLGIRRTAIFAIMLLAYVYYRSSGEEELASIGLLSFAAIAQLAPAFFGGLFWRRATERGAIAGMTAGIFVWAYTLLLPSLGLLDPAVLSEGPFGLALLRPQNLIGIDLPPLVHGVMWSLAINIAAYVAFSVQRPQTAIERLQANLFTPSGLAPITPSFRRWRSSVTVEELTTTVARYVGEERTRQAFESFASTRRISLAPGTEADFHLLRHAEHLIASAIGAASSRLVLSLLLRKRNVSTKAALKLLDDANAAIQYNREVLQSALDHVGQGIAVFDKDLHLVCWNRQFGELLDLPPERVRVGTSLAEILRFNARRVALGPGDMNQFVNERIVRYIRGDTFFERFADRGLVVEVRASAMPDGGIVATLTDMTPSVKAAEDLERANETLERRVEERTHELMLLNDALQRAKAEAEEANISKTRFLAAASHDILQPLNAARLYVTSLVERQSQGDERRLANNIDASLEAVEEILGALLEISRLDSGAMKPEISAFPINGLLRQLEVEFTPLARARGLRLVFVPSSASIESDRRLLRRILQNLVSNAIKYTPNGRILVGCRRVKKRLRIHIYDTGIGIPRSKQKIIFKEFHRLEQGALVARGLGLGLSIVDRIARALGHKIEVQSSAKRGAHFWMDVPLAAVAPPVPAPVDEPRTESGRMDDLTVLCIDNEPRILDGMEVLLTGWHCKVLTATDLTTAITAVESSGLQISGLLVDYHLDHGNGAEAIHELRLRYGADLPAVLITANRSRVVRDEARAQNIQVLTKPVKPAALRALLMQWQIQQVAAE